MFKSYRGSNRPHTMALTFRTGSSFLLSGSVPPQCTLKKNESAFLDNGLNGFFTKHHKLLTGPLILCVHWRYLRAPSGHRTLSSSSVPMMSGKLLIVKERGHGYAGFSFFARKLKGRKHTACLWEKPILLSIARISLTLLAIAKAT